MILKLFPEAGIPRKVPEGVPDPSPRTIIRSPATRTSLISHFRSGKVARWLLNPPMTFSRGKQASFPPHDIQSDEMACSSWPHLSPGDCSVLHKTASRLHGPFRLSEFELRRATPGMLRAPLLIRLSLRSQCNSLHLGYRPCSLKVSE